MSIAVILGLATSPTALAAEDDAAFSEAVLVDGDRFQGKLIAIGPDAVRFEKADGETIREARVASRDLLKWGEPAVAAKRPTVLLRNGSRLVAAPAWTLDGSVRFADSLFTIRQTLLDDAELPRDSIQAILFEAARDPRLFAPAIEQATRGSGPIDRVWLTDGDQFAGELSSIGSGRLAIRIDGDTIEFALRRVACVRLAGQTGAASAPSVAIGLRDGSQLLAEQATLTEEAKLTVAIAGGLALEGKRAGAVVHLQPLGGRVTYLSALTPIDYRHTPYFDLLWGYGRDKNLNGEPLRSSGRRWLKGLAVHSASRLVYAVPESANRLECELAIDDGAESRTGSVVFRVLVARGGRFTPAYTSPAINEGGSPLPMTVDVAGAQAVALLVDYGGDGDAGDHADWLDARFVE